MNDTFRPQTGEDQPELGLLSRVLINIAGADPDVVLKKCPEDIGNLKAAGTIALGAFFYNSTVFSAVATHLNGHFSAGLVAGGVALAGYILATDSYIFFRCAQLKSGFEQLAQAGLEVSIPRKVRKMVRRALGIRIAQSCCLGIVVGVMTSLVVYSRDIEARIQSDYLRANATQVRQLSEQTDTDTKRANQALNATTATINQLSKQINAALARGVNGANGARLEALEGRKAAEETKLAAQKAELSQLQNVRNEKLRAGLAGDPTSVRATGVLAQITALEELAGDDWKIAFIILLIDIVAVGFDLAPILAKLNWLPTTYSALMAREYLERMQKIVDEMVPPGPDHPDDPMGVPAGNDNNPFGGNDQFANDNVDPAQPKRKRGRPRKYPLPAVNGSGQATPEGE